MAHAEDMAQRVFDAVGVAVAVCALVRVITGDKLPWLVGIGFALAALLIVLARPEVRRSRRRPLRRQS